LREADAQKVLAVTVFVPVPPQAMAPYIPWRFVIYPWVATAPRCFHWWQYPWYAAPWWAPPWTSYWQVAYYPTPWGYWYLPPGYWPAPIPYPRSFPPVERPAALITVERTAESLYLEGFDRYWDGDASTARRMLSAAVERDTKDARVWYFKALAE